MTLRMFVGLPRAPLDTVLAALTDRAEVLNDAGSVSIVQSPYGVSVWRRVVRSISERVPTSAAPSGAWSVWCIACPGERNTQRTFRWLARYRIEYPDRVLGPYDTARFIALAETRTDDDGNALADLFADGHTPWVMLGESSLTADAGEYEPTDGEAAED